MTLAELSYSAVRIDWCVEWNLFFRVHSEGTEQSGNWAYVYYPTEPEMTINLHEFNEPASIWLDDKEKFWKKLLPIVSEVNHFYCYDKEQKEESC